jgi:hypothetical protein
MTKPVAVLCSGVIGDSRHIDTARLDEPRFSDVNAPGVWLVVGCWLVTMLDVSGISRPGRIGHSDPQRQRPSTGSIWRPISRTTGFFFFLLDRAVGRWSESGIFSSRRDVCAYR